MNRLNNVPQLSLDEYPHLCVEERQIWRFYFEVKSVSSRLITIHIPSREINLNVPISKFPVEHIVVGDYFFGRGNKDVKNLNHFVITEIESPQPLGEFYARMINT